MESYIFLEFPTGSFWVVYDSACADAGTGIGKLSFLLILWIGGLETALWSISAIGSQIWMVGIDKETIDDHLSLLIIRPIWFSCVGDSGYIMTGGSKSLKSN